MIRLTLNVKSEPEIHLFNKAVIVIGSELSSEADICLPGLNLQPAHIKIMEQDGFLIIINITNDPFVSLNGHPFGKKLLKTGDIIVVHQVEILFENLNDQLNIDKTIPEGIQTELSKNQKQEVSQLKDSSILDFALPFENDVETLKEGEWHSSDIDHYLKELEQHQAAGSLQREASSIALANKVEERKQSISLKDDYLKELDDDNQAIPIGLQPTEQNHLYQAWKWIIFFIFSVLTIAGIIGTVIYLTVSDSTEAQEEKVAQAMSDIAMALMHAQLYHLKPHNQNWSDVDFIKTNLQSILPDTTSFASEIDAQGQFHCCAYSLRIYTSSDLSRFLLIAQPAPSLLHWLIPKSTVLIDSQAMELRTIKDLRTLNRLLANADPLEGTSGKEIHSLIKQGELIRLSSLGSEDRHPDFIPPKNLAWIRPGAENFIYNAPRYYRLGQTIIQKALTLSTSKGSSQEVTALKEDMEGFARLQNLVLYAEQGKKSALLTKQGILTFAPSDKVLFGYLVFNSQGKIHQVHLLKDDEELKEPSALVTISKEKDAHGEQIAFQTSSDKVNRSDKMNHPLDEHKQVDINHPIYIQLNSLATLRENELRPLVQELTEMLNHETQTPTHDFQERFQNCSHQYLMTDAKHKEKIKKALSTLYYQYDDLPINQFIHFAKQVGCDQLIHQNDQSSFTLVDENCLQNLETMLTQIENSKTLIELDNLIHIANSWLTFDYIKNSQDLLKYQNHLRNQVLNQIEKFILTEQKESAHFTVEDKEILERILNHERLIQPEEKEFFLAEFDRTLDQQENSESEKTKESEF